MDLSKVSTQDLMALQSGDLSKVSTEGLMMLQGGAPKPEKGYIESLGAGLGKGVGTVALGAQDLVGMGLEKLGANQAGKWLQTDAELGRRKLSSEVAPYKEANPMTTGGGELAGEIAATLPVGAGLASGLSKVAPSATRLAEALRSGGMSIGGPAAPLLSREGAKQLAIRGTGGAAVGGASAGLVNPSDADVGAVIGGALPVVGKGAMVAGRMAGAGAKSLIEPLYEAGQTRILGRALTDAAGSDAQKAMANLANAPELVQGSLPTAAEAAGVPSMAAMQRAAMAVNPEATNALAARQLSQNEARLGVLNELAGTGGAKTQAEGVRDAMAEATYQSAKRKDLARRETAIADQIAKDQGNIGLGSLGNVPQRTESQSAAMAIRPTKTLEDLASRPAFSGFIKDAQKLAANKGFDIGNPLTSIDGLHYIKLAIDDALQPSATNPLGRNAKSALMDMKDKLVTEMDKISPVYGVAREAYQEFSKPINQMAIGEELLKTVRPLDQKIMAGQFAKRLSDETAQAATGFKGSTLENTLTPEQLQKLQAVQQDLARSNFADTAGRGVGSNTVQNLAYSNMLNQAGVPTMLRGLSGSQVLGNLAAKAGDVVYGKANKQMSQRLAEALMSPQETLSLMQEAQKSGNSALVAALRDKLPMAYKAAYRTAPILAAE